MANSSQNHLANESSLYLQQHANQPVDWYPWCEEALKLAKENNKPILLSIGYSACHWCHRMAQESFSDPATAELMNRYFINIKVDREERPDLDKIYQLSSQILTGKPGGWPLTIFLTPDTNVAFFAGTYFPPRAGFGQPAFKEVLQKIALFYEKNLGNVQQIVEKMQTSLTQFASTQNENAILNYQPLEISRLLLARNFDHKNGGFGNAPKFPTPPHLDRLLNLSTDPRKLDYEALNMCLLSLKRMAEGGIFDQIGGGFFRYAVDAAWMTPHFEKMLYDNAQLLPLYARAFAISQDNFFKEIVIETIEWLLHEMQAVDGAFYSTLNADSEKVEGKFYVWQRNEIKELLTKNEYAFAEKFFGLNLPANFENQWHLYRTENLEVVSKELSIKPEKSKQFLKSIKEKLFRQRDLRVHPDRDEKILTAWNALLIKGFLISAKFLHHHAYFEMAEKVLDFIHTHLWKKGKLYTNYKYKKAQTPAFLDDYVFLLEALMCFLEAQWSTRHLNFALEIANTLIKDFYDEKSGAFFFTSNEHETLIQRPKSYNDEATPSGNGIAAYCFVRLGYLLGEQNYLDIAEKALKSAWTRLQSYPESYDSFLIALEEYLNPPTQIILRGKASQLLKWKKIVDEYHYPHVFCYAIPDGTTDLPDALNKPEPKKGAVAYICQGKECRETLQTEQEFRDYLEKAK